MQLRRFMKPERKETAIAHEIISLYVFEETFNENVIRVLDYISQHY